MSREIVEEYVFENMDDFFKSINEGDAWRMHPALGDFHEAYSKINIGCGCNKKPRVQRAEYTYARVPNMDQGTAFELRHHYGAKAVILKHRGIVVGSF